MKRTRRFLTLLAMGLLFASLSSLLPQAVSARSGGIAGRSTTGCGGSGCHSTTSASVPTATIIGPTTVQQSSSNSYTFRVQVPFGAINDAEAGFDVSRTSGTLAASGSGTEQSGLEVTHSTPKIYSCTPSTCTVEWTFSWTAPSSGSSATLRGAGNSVNGNNSTSGDRWDLTTLSISVVPPPVLTVSRLGTGTGTVTGSGINCGGDCSQTYSLNQAVTLTATPLAGNSTFTGWGGSGCSGTSTTCNITMSMSRAVTATFTSIPRTLTAQKIGTGSGTVTGGGISCGANCSVVVNSGTNITLSATPSAGSQFDGWSGACSGTGTCNLTMNSNLTATADFAPIIRTLTVVGATGGSITGGLIDCGATCSAMVNDGTVVTLNRNPDLGYIFGGWGGSCSGTGACVVTMDQNRTVSGSFTSVPIRSLTLNKTGVGTVTSTGGEGGVNCDPGCSSEVESFTDGDVVTLSASASFGYVFMGWSGGGCAGTGSCVVTMDQNQAVTATFDLLPSYTLSVSTTGPGTITSDDFAIDCGLYCVATYAAGEVRTLTATPDSGYVLDSWTGDCSGAGSCVVTLTEVRTVGATFIEFTQSPDLTIALFTNPAYVDYVPANSSSEAANLEAALAADARDVTVFTDLTFEKGEFNVVMIPELELSDLESQLDAAARSAIESFVRNGGTLITFADGSSHERALLDTVFGWSLGAPLIVGTLTQDSTGASGTPFAAGATSLTPFSKTFGTTDTSLPPGAHVIYADGSNAAVWIVRHGGGWVVSIGWDFFDAAPVGTRDGGWLEVLASAIDLSATGITVGLYARSPYIDYSLGSIGSEGSNLDVELRSQGHVVDPFVGFDDVVEIALFTDLMYVDYMASDFNSEASNLASLFSTLGDDVVEFTGTTFLDFSTALAGREVLVVPELEIAASLSSALDPSTQTLITDFVSDGGTLVTFGDSGNRGTDLLNLLFGFGANSSSIASGATLPIDAVAAVGTPLANGPLALTSLNANFVTPPGPLPGATKVIYSLGGDAAVYAVPVGAGWVVWLGWDWYNAAPVGTEDGGWLNVLELVLELRGSFVSLDGYDVVVLPEIEIGSLTTDLSAAGKSSLNAFIFGGGRLVTSGSTQNRLFLNDVFGWTLIGNSTGVDHTIQPDALGTGFADGPASLPSPSATSSVLDSSLPPGSLRIYQSGSSVGVSSIPHGAGWVTVLGWDFYNAEPVGTEDGGWLQTLNSAIVPEPGLPVGILVGVLALALRQRACAVRQQPGSIPDSHTT